MTRKPVIHAGLNIKIVTAVLDKGRKASNITVTKHPPPNSHKSKGLNIPNINCPLLVLAGIK